MVVSTIVTPFALFNSAISTNRKSSWVQSRIAVTQKGIEPQISSLGTLKGSVIFPNHIGELNELLVRKMAGFRDNKPVDILSAWGSGLRSLIINGVNGIVGDQALEVDPRGCQSLTTDVQSADGRTSANGCVGVGHTVITLFSKGEVNNSITTERTGAFSSTPDDLARSKITFFIRIGHSISAIMFFAV